MKASKLIFFLLKLMLRGLIIIPIFIIFIMILPVSPVISAPGLIVAFFIFYKCVLFPLKIRMIISLLFYEHDMLENRDFKKIFLSLSKTQNKFIRKQLVRIADLLDEGKTLSQAIASAPKIFPKEIAKILEIGEAIGDISKVTPVIKNILEENKNRMASTSVIITYSLYLPFIYFYSSINTRFMFFRHIQYVFPGTVLYSDIQGVINFSISIFCLLFFPIFFLGMLPYIRLSAFSKICSYVEILFPWYKKRIYRNFSIYLSLLLDGNVPEEKAVLMAGEATDNKIIKRQAEKVVQSLQQGIPLTEALATIDKSREFMWRFRNAYHVSASFVKSLEGWHEMLSAQIFKSEQIFTKVLTSILILFNGTMVGITCIYLFKILIYCIEHVE